MSRLTKGERERLRHQLLTALVPADPATRTALEHEAFRAVITDYYEPAGLKRLAALPQEWFEHVNGTRVLPTGTLQTTYIRGPGMNVPRQPPDNYRPGPAAQAAVDRWYTHVTEFDSARRSVGHRIDTVLNACQTLEALLAKLPEARGILSLPVAADVPSSAAEINALLAQKAPAAAAAAKPAPARKKPTARKA